MREGTTFSYFLTDNLGSVVGVTDSSGTLVSESRYLPFGETRTDVGTITQTDFGYTFQRNLTDTGLIRERTVDMWTTTPALREAPLWGTTRRLGGLFSRIRWQPERVARRD